MLELSKDELGHLHKSLSGLHHNAYLRHSNGCETQALELYRWNMRISSHFMIPINITETVIQRAISESIEASYGPDWLNSKMFLNSIKNPEKNRYNPRKDIKNCRKNWNANEIIITKLKFVFWESMLVSSYDNSIWKLHIRNQFPYSPCSYSVGQIRHELHTEIRKIRNFRNKVFHHDPIFLTELNSEIKRMDMVVRWRCEVTADWMKKINPVPEFLNTRPKWLDE